MAPSYMNGSGTQWNPGTAVSGNASSHRISIAIKPPIDIMNSAMNRNWRAIIL